MKLALVALLLSSCLAWTYASVDLYQLRSDLEALGPVERADLVNSILIVIAPFLIDALVSIVGLLLTPTLGPLAPLVTPILFQLGNLAKTLVNNVLTATTVAAATTVATTVASG